ncbi:MAG: hypothetical protein ACRD0E_10585, partial [Acidimicrobiales bacterium]
TYMHGPVLARNPHLADFVLGLALGPDVALGHWSQSEMGAPLDSEVERLRTERLSHPGYGRGSLGSRARHGLSGLGLRRPRR